jgi:hypothetical protein
MKMCERFSHLRISPQPEGRFTNRPYANNLATARLVGALREAPVQGDAADKL